MERFAVRRTSFPRWCLALSLTMSCSAWADDSAMLELLKVLRDNGLYLPARRGAQGGGEKLRAGSDGRQTGCRATACQGGG